ncbi:M20 family metallopeptidase [Nosocomiicoccus ampullae]|uniref:Peptidase M20 domain-containing protein 2 n=1 Tax=Nosocomiicoccus ampullae TaxID=489910 RepID=A0A9Q2HG81_9STAP|nr:M20 family metallopeptidase [Nosocomiicoccus ampullae]MBB5176217.1 amidohydrolase [Nosocomiicoccus ampullae]QYA47382.1 M20 family metallopeptidase [Nosocomiicoccus ampullae]
MEITLQDYETIKKDLEHNAIDMYRNPELGDEEYRAMRLLTSELEKHGFIIDTNIVNRPTAFIASYESEKEGPTICYLAEYDALKGLGHACGHNLIGNMSVGAGILLSKRVDETGGKVVVVGTPAEETNGAKVTMAEEGIFDDMDVALMVHPSDVSSESGDMLAIDPLQFDFYGKAAHAAGNPEEGINALDGVLQLFNGINPLREHLKDDVRIHGIIINGGDAANIVPEHATAQFYIRANERDYLDEVVEKIRNVAKGAALMTGTEVVISNYELSYNNLIPNDTLSELFTKHHKKFTDRPINKKEKSTGSADIGDVSHRIPALHPYVGMNCPGVKAHTPEFREQTISEDGFKALEEAVLALSNTGLELLENREVLEAVKKEQAERLKK